MRRKCKSTIQAHAQEIQTSLFTHAIARFTVHKYRATTTLAKSWLRSPTSYPGSFLFLPRESTLVSAGHVAPKIWVPTRMYYRGGVAKCKIVTSVRMVESTGGDVSFFRNICGDKNSSYRQVFLHYIRRFDIEAVHVIFDTFASLWISKHCR